MSGWEQVLASSGATLLIIGAGYLANRKLGIGQGQQLLVKTLEETVRAQQDRVTQLSHDFDTCKAQLARALVTSDDAQLQIERLRARLTRLERSRP